MRTKFEFAEAPCCERRWGATLVGVSGMLADALTDTGGELFREERRWADEVLGVKGQRQEPGCIVAGVTMDAGGLIAVDRDDRRIVVLLARARETGSRVTVRGALAQAVRQPQRQTRLARLLRQPTTDVIPLDRVDATNVGRLLAASGTADVVDAHVVICARRARQQVVTSDPDDLRALDPTLRVVTI